MATPLELVPKLMPGQRTYKAEDLNAVIDFVQKLRTQGIIAGPGILCTVGSAGIMISATAQPTSQKLYKVVCNGPEDADDPSPRTDETYWLQEDAASGDPDDYPVTFADPAGSIILATNTEEVDYHTHGLRVGTVITNARQLADGRWIFSK